MANSTREGYRYLQVDRLITNRPSAFLGKVATLGKRMFGEVSTSAIVDYVLPSTEDDTLAEPRLLTMPINEPLLEVYGADSVRMLLLRKSVPVSMERRYNFNHHASRFTAHPKLRAVKGGAQHKQQPTVREKLDTVAVELGQNPRNMTVEFNRVIELSDLGFGTELALVPRIGTIGSIVLREQAKICSEELAELSNNAAYPTSPLSPTVPFMRVPEGIGAARYDRFVTSIYEQLLPLQLTLGELDAHSRKIAANGC